MATTGLLRTWLNEEGWGVLDSAETPGGCWAHFSAVVMEGYRSLEPGQAVTFDWEPALQDGYFYSAVRVWPADRPPAGTLPEKPEASDAYASRLDIVWDEQPGSA